MKRKILIIAGPTAVGKTEYAIKAAQALNGEIVSADSMQLYKYMDIGSAKPTPEEREAAVHHMVDEIDPSKPFSVYEYQRLARKAIEEVFSRGRLPIVSGGTGLYVNSLIYDMDFSARPEDNSCRQRLEELARAEGKEALHERLRALDPEAAERIHPNNVKKVIRALEMLSEGQERVRGFEEAFVKTDAYDVCLIGLTRDREELYNRINLRVDLLFEAGLVDEVKRLGKMGLSADDISMKGIGYKEIFGYLNGEYSLEEAAELVKKNTRHYAKRQLTWFRRYDEIKWINLSTAASPEAAVEEIVKYFQENK